MPVALNGLSKSASTCHHFTSIHNFSSIRRSGQLEFASYLMRRANHSEFLQVRRTKREFCGEVLLQSQRPLIADNIERSGAGWAMKNLLEHLNGFVFFWPGKDSGPIKNVAVGYLSRGDGRSGGIAMRVPSRDLLLDLSQKPLFCQYNLAQHDGPREKASPRGPDTFLPANCFEGTVSEVIEVVFPNCVNLPGSTSCSKSFTEPCLSRLMIGGIWSTNLVR